MAIITTTRQLHAATRSDDVLRILLHAIMQSLPVTACASGEVCDGLLVLSHLLRGQNETKIEIHYAPGEGLVGQALVTHAPVALDAHAFPADPWLTTLPDLGHVLVVPMSLEKGPPWGGLVLTRNVGEQGFSADEIAMVTALAEHGALALQRVRSRHRCRHTQDRLTRSKVRLSRIAASIPGMVFQLMRPPQGGDVFRSFGGRVEEDTGFNAEDLQHHAERLFSLIHPAYVDNIRAAIDASAATRHPLIEEFQICLPNGVHRWLTWRAIPEHLDDGTVIWNGVIIDVTDRKEMEDALRSSREHLAALIEASPLAIVTVDTQRRVTGWNYEAERIFGWRADEVLGQELPYVPDDERQLGRELDQRVLEGEGYRNLELVRQRKDGSRIDVKASLAPIRDPAGRVTGIVGILDDVTEQRQIAAALSESEGRYRSLFTLMAEGFFIGEIVYDREGHAVDFRFLEINPAFERLTNLSRNAVMGRKVRDVLPGIEEYWIEKYAHVVATGTPIVFEQYAEPLHRYYYGYAYRTQPGQFAVIFIDLTDIKRTEQALRESEERYRVAFEKAAIGIANVTPAGRFLQVNPQLADILGYTVDELIGRKIADVTHPDEQMEDRSMLRQMVSGEIKLYTREKRFIRQDGAIVWGNMSAYLLRDATGKPLYAVMTIEDITYRKRVEAAVREIMLKGTSSTGASFFERMAEEMARTVQADFVLIGELPDAEHLRTYALLADGALRENREIDIAGTPYAEVITRGLIAVPQHAWQQFPDDAFLKEHRIESLVGVALIDPQGETIGIVASLFRQPVRDLRFAETLLQLFASRIGAEIERRRNEAALQTQRALLSTAIDILPFPILFWDETGTLVRVNMAAMQMLHGDDPMAMLDQGKVKFLNPQTHAEIAPAEWPRARAMRGEVVSSYEAIIAFPDGRELPILAQAAPIYAEGKLIATIAAFQDISKLKEADHAKDQFLMVLTHELKTPLTSIIGWAQAARSMEELVPKALDIILRNADEQKHLLQDLIDVSRVIYGRLYLKLESISLWALVTREVERFAEEAQRRGIRVEIAPVDDEMRWQADPARIRQVIGGLMGNSMKYTEAGGEIRVAGAVTDEAFVIMISDTGRGIPADEIELIFQPFRQFERAEAVGGMGMGLTLVKGIVEAHGGTITAESGGRGCGSRFIITFPRAASQQQAA